MLLPSGEPPRGKIVENVVPEELSFEEVILSLGGRIAASSMELFPGGPVAMESDPASRPIVRAAFKEAGKICGVHLEPVAAAVLNAKQIGKNVFEFELYYFSRSMWRCQYILKKR
jgi:hypothetical protein